MPGSTSLGIRYPLSSEAPAGHSQMQTLAGDVNLLLDQGFAGFPFAVQAGGPVAFAFGGGAGPVGVPVTFTAGRFTQAPLLVFGLNMGTYTGAKTPRLSPGGGSTAGFTFNCYLEGGAFTGTIYGYWLAIQMLPGAAAG